jgi:Tn3 transposase DDE domain
VSRGRVRTRCAGFLDRCAFDDLVEGSAHGGEGLEGRVDSRSFCVKAALNSVTWDRGATIESVWAAIDKVVSRTDLTAAVANLTILPPPEADPGGQWRETLLDRYQIVRRFVPQLCEVVTIRDPESLTVLRKMCEAMFPRVDIGEVIIDVMGWHPGFVEAFSSASGGKTRLDDLDITIAAALTAHALNIGFTPVISGQYCQPCELLPTMRAFRRAIGAGFIEWRYGQRLLGRCLDRTR